MKKKLGVMVRIHIEIEKIEGLRKMVMSFKEK